MSAIGKMILCLSILGLLNPWLTAQNVLKSEVVKIQSFPPLNLLENEDVWKDLQLTKDQVSKLKEMFAKRHDIIERQPKGLPEADRQFLADFHLTVFNVLLTLDQKKRLEQIDWQMQARRLGPALLLKIRTAEALDITREQSAKIVAVDEARDAELRKRVAELQDETVRKLTSMLSPSQLKKRQELLGEPYTGSFEPVRQDQSPLGQRINLLINLLRIAEVQKELKLSKEQVIKANEIGAEFQGKRQEYQAVRKVGQSVKDLLNPEQVTRLDQIVDLHLTGPARTIASASSPRIKLLQIADIQKELKLSKEQVNQAREIDAKLWGIEQKAFPKDNEARERRLEEIRKVDQAEAKLLNPEQRKRLDQIVEQKFFRHHAPQATLSLSERLQTTADQNEKMTSIYASYWNERKRKEAEHRAETTEKLISLLTPEQQKVWKDLLGAPFKGSFLPRDPIPMGIKRPEKVGPSRK